MCKGFFTAVVMVFVFIFGGVASADVAPDGAHSITVKRGDTVLGSIRREANTGMPQGAFLQEMARLNPGMNLHRILPKQTLFVPNGVGEIKKENARLVARLEKVTADIGAVEARLQQSTATTVASRDALVKVREELGKERETSAKIHTDLAAVSEVNTTLRDQLARVTAQKDEVEGKVQELTTVNTTTQEALVNKLEEEQEALEREQQQSVELRTALAEVLAEKGEVERQLQEATIVTTKNTENPTRPLAEAAGWIVGVLAIGTSAFVYFHRRRSSPQEGDLLSEQEKYRHLAHAFDDMKRRADRMERHLPGNKWECEILNEMDRLNCDINSKSTKISCIIMRATFDPAHPDEPVIEVKAPHAEEWLFPKNVRNSYMTSVKKLLAEKNNPPKTVV